MKQYEVHLCKGCIKDLEEHYPYLVPREHLKIVEVSIDECDNTNLDDYNERLSNRNKEYFEEVSEMRFYVKHNGKEYEFGSGAECLIFDYANYNDIPESEILTYVNLVHYLYLKDNNPTPLGHLCDYIAEHWKDVLGKDKWEILSDFYMSL